MKVNHKAFKMCLDKTVQINTLVVGQGETKTASSNTIKHWENGPEVLFNTGNALFLLRVVIVSHVPFHCVEHHQSHSARLHCIVVGGDVVMQSSITHSHTVASEMIITESLPLW